jgi:hypothetical protein
MADTNNLAIWDKLGKTDPAHTKKFKRAGGFGGTAIKPIYTTQKMTEEFGPAGKGWGMGEPSFQTIPASEGQVAVYCTVSLWWVDPADADGTVNTVYGVGGDMVVVKQSSGLRTDDEAFKKAFTDALGNAMKHLGMSADVHMGLFDDSKYVAEVERELSQGPAFTQPQPKAASRELHQAMLDKIIEAGRKGRTALREYWTSEEFIAGYEVMPDDWKKSLDDEKDAFLASYAKPTGRVDPNESLNQQFAATVAN